MQLFVKMHEVIDLCHVMYENMYQYVSAFAWCLCDGFPLCRADQQPNQHSIQKTHTLFQIAATGALKTNCRETHGPPPPI